MPRNTAVIAGLLGLAIFVVQAQVAQKTGPVVKGFQGAEPLVVVKMNPDDPALRKGWIRVDWDPRSPVSKRRVIGDVSSSTFSPTNLLLRLHGVSPRNSENEKERENFARIYAEGLVRIIEQRKRPFAFAVVKETNPGIWQFSGRIGDSVDFVAVSNPASMQLEMVEKGFATVNQRDPSTMSDISSDYYRDNLLRAEGAARALKLGVWEKD